MKSEYRTKRLFRLAMLWSLNSCLFPFFFVLSSLICFAERASALQTHATPQPSYTLTNNACWLTVSLVHRTPYWPYASPLQQICTHVEAHRNHSQPRFWGIFAIARANPHLSTPWMAGKCPAAPWIRLNGMASALLHAQLIGQEHINVDSDHSNFATLVNTKETLFLTQAWGQKKSPCYRQGSAHKPTPWAGVLGHLKQWSCPLRKS